MIQALIVAAIVLFCLWQVARRWLPVGKTAATPPATGCGPGGCEACGACKALAFTVPERDIPSPPAG